MVITWEDALAASRAEGMETGRLQGQEQGIQQGEASVLRRLLIMRFPPLPNSRADTSSSGSAAADYATPLCRTNGDPEAVPAS